MIMKILKKLLVIAIGLTVLPIALILGVTLGTIYFYKIWLDEAYLILTKKKGVM